MMTTRKFPYTVYDLVSDLLQEYPDDILRYDVKTEGCDCIGPGNGIEVDHEKQRVIILRVPGE